MTSRHYSNDAKEADILDRCGLPLNGIKLGVFNIAIYEIIVRCSFKANTLSSSLFFYSKNNLLKCYIYRGYSNVFVEYGFYFIE